MPHLSLELLLALTAWPEAQAVVPRDAEGQLHPLCALYDREAVLPVARERLARGQRALHGLLEAVETDELDAETLAVLDPGGRALANVNTPEELARALD